MLNRFPSILLLILTALIVTACSNDKLEIHQLLDARDQAVSSRNIGAYSALIDEDYQHLGQSTADVLIRMEELFFQFDTLEMHSSDRSIYFSDDNHAQCEQSYILKVKADGNWRSIAQRERLDLTKTVSGWKISGGL